MEYKNNVKNSTTLIVKSLYGICWEIIYTVNTDEKQSVDYQKYWLNANTHLNAVMKATQYLRSVTHLGQ